MLLIVAGGVALALAVVLIALAYNLINRGAFIAGILAGVLALIVVALAYGLGSRKRW